MPSSAAASPFPAPSSPDQFACDLWLASDPSDFSTWWTAVPQNSTLAGWFWGDIMPNNASTSCRSDVAATFWGRAVPSNWAFVPNLGGWPWATGGYYTQTLWLHAIPEGWAAVPNIGGWPSATGGYYAHRFWLHAVPENWASIGNIGGWRWPAGGYYTQWLWLQAIPANWAVVPNIGGWPWPAGGYYTQCFGSTRSRTSGQQSPASPARGILSRVVDWPAVVTWRSPVVALDVDRVAEGRVSAKERDQAAALAALS